MGKAHQLLATVASNCCSHIFPNERAPPRIFCVCSGIFAALAVGLIFCAEHLRDTLFIRPHPAVWRFVTGIGLFYTMFCTYLLFQSATDVRTKILPQLDSGVTGEPPAHRSYGESCELTWPNVKVRGWSAG
jgi:hypothetical protein